jgi:hypothetical protein
MVNTSNNKTTYKSDDDDDDDKISNIVRSNICNRYSLNRSSLFKRGGF